MYPSKTYAFSTKCLIPTGVRAFSTSKSEGSPSDLVVFFDADKDKLDILKYIKG